MNKGLLIGIGAGVSALSGLVLTKLVLKSKRRKAWLEALKSNTDGAMNTLVDYICNTYKEEQKIRKLKLLYNEINEDKDIPQEIKDKALIIVAEKITEVGGGNSCGEETTKEETVKEETVKEETVKEETVKEETVKEETVKEETVKEETVKEETVEEETVEEETVEEGPTIQDCTNLVQSIIDDLHDSKEETVKEEPVKYLPEYLRQVNDRMPGIRELIELKRPYWNELIWVPLKYNENLVNDFLEASLGMDEGKTEEGKAIINQMADIRRELQDIRARIPILVEVVVEPVVVEPVAESVAESVVESVVEPVVEPKQKETDDVTEAIMGLTKQLEETEALEDTKEKIERLEKYVSQIDVMLKTLKPLTYVNTIADHVKTIKALRDKASAISKNIRNGRIEKVIKHVKKAEEAIAQGKAFEEVAPDMTKKIIDEYLPLTEEEVDKDEMETVSAIQSSFLENNKPAYDVWKDKLDSIKPFKPSISNKRKNKRRK